MHLMAHKLSMLVNVLDINLGKFSLITAKIASAFFSVSFQYSYYAYLSPFLTISVLGYFVLFFFFSLFLFAFQFWNLLLSYPQAQRFFLQPCPVYMFFISVILHILHICCSVFDLKHFFLIMSQNIHLLAYILHVFLYVAHFFC